MPVPSGGGHQAARARDPGAVRSGHRTAAATRRLTTPETDDEISRLGQTLNRMLDRIQASAAIERRFLDDASHELRTPLGILRSEVDLALSRSRSIGELEAA